MGEWVQIYYRRTTTIDKMLIYAPAYTTYERMPSDFRLYGSLDGIEWVMIKEWTNYTRQHWYPDGIVWPYTDTKRILPVKFLLDNQVSYPYFRIAVNKATFTSRGTGNTSLFIREIEFYLGDNEKVLYETLNSGALDVYELPYNWVEPYFYKEPVNYFFPQNSLIFNDIYISPGMGDTPTLGLIHPEFEQANSYVSLNNINVSKISPYIERNGAYFMTSEAARDLCLKINENSSLNALVTAIIDPYNSNNIIINAKGDNILYGFGQDLKTQQIYI